VGSRAARAGGGSKGGVVAVMKPHKGYTGTVWFEPDDRLFHGHVAGIRHIVHFAGASVDELEQAFRDSVDDYLAWAAEDGFEPEPPFAGGLTLTLSPEEHRLLRDAADLARRPTEAWARDALLTAARGAALRRAG
jgi:predicted HicB family RNase H-like nuclease